MYVCLCNYNTYYKCNNERGGAGVKCEVQGASLRRGKMRGTVRGINARHWVICKAGMCEAQRTTGAAGVVVGCEPLKRNYLSYC